MTFSQIHIILMAILTLMNLFDLCVAVTVQALTFRGAQGISGTNYKASLVLSRIYHNDRRLQRCYPSSLLLRETDSPAACFAVIDLSRNLLIYHSGDSGTGCALSC